MKAHLLYCPFTGLGNNDGYRGDEWLRHRITVFKRFVLPSLMRQTKKEFILWVSWRPKERHNPQVMELERMLKQLRGFSTVFTYAGTCFYDDKYEDDLARERLKRSLSMSLPSLEPHVKDADWVYLTIQPSDDVYELSAVEKIQSVAPVDGKAVAYRHGYIMNYATKEVAEYDPETLSPFSTVIFAKDTFIDSKKHFERIGPYRSHEYVFDHMEESEWLEGRGYMVGTHGENISTTWNIGYKGKEVLGTLRDEVWLKFACWDADPVVVHKSLRLVLRTVFNFLPVPVQKIVKITYHSFRELYYAFK